MLDSFAPRTASVLLLLAQQRVLGGRGSGNFGHEGRPGEVGGSASATNLAREASAIANASGLKVDHALAAVAHEEASRLHAKEGNKTAAAAHARYVDLHRGKIRGLGGKGSGNYGHAGRKGERGGSSEATTDALYKEGKLRSERSLRALKAFVPVSQKGQRFAEASERRIARMVRGEVVEGTRDAYGVVQRNAPVDVVTHFGGRMQGIEVKTLLNQTNDKLTVRKAAAENKTFWGRSNHASVHIVAVDMRPGKNGQIYYRSGHGSFRLSSMTKVRDAAHLRSLLGEHRAAAQRETNGVLFEPLPGFEWVGREVE